MKRAIKGTAILYAFIGILFSFSTISLALDNFSSKNSTNNPSQVSQIEEEEWAEDVKAKMDKAIAVMKILREDMDEFKKGDLKSKPSASYTTWSENLKDNIDDMIKVMKVIKEDVNEIEKLDENKKDYRLKSGEKE